MVEKQIPDLGEIGLDRGRETEVETALNQAAVHIPISQLDLAPAETVEPSDSVLQAVVRMTELKIGSLLVVEGGKLAGIVTERDIMMGIDGEQSTVMQARVSNLMTPNPTTLSPGDLVTDAMAVMDEGGYRRVPVVDEEGAPVGVLSIKRVVERLVESFPEEILNLPPQPVRGMRTREGA